MRHLVYIYIHNHKKTMAIMVATLLIIATMALSLTGCGAGQELSQDTQAGGINSITKDGVTYQKKTRIKTYLILGVDSWEDDERNTEDHIIAGQSDFIELLIIDQNNKAYYTLPINRNTITAVDSLDHDGSYQATADLQICLAHANGTGGKDSSENTVKAVSIYLDGVKIDGYASVSLDSIATINDMVGGVTITIEDDFSDCDQTLKMGETITLNGEQAEHFARGRMNVADGTNVNRMKRQKQYSEALRQKLTEQVQADKNFAIKFYEDLDSFMETNLKGKDFSKIANTVAKLEYKGSVEIDGQVVIDDMGWEAFHPDEDSKEAAILSLYYEPTE